MVNITLEETYIDGLNKKYSCYANKQFYLRGYAPYFTKETSIKILTDIKQDYNDKNYKVTWGYNKEEDYFFFNDLENGEGTEVYKGRNIKTEHGIKHLYPIGMDWMWQIEE